MSADPGDPSADQAPQCPRCGADMQEGFLRDAAHGAVLQSTWVEGAPVKSIWTGIKLRGLVQIPVTTFRCAQCGYLESYAIPAPEAPDR